MEWKGSLTIFQIFHFVLKPAETCPKCVNKLYLVTLIEIQLKFLKIFPKIPLGKFKSFFLITLLLSEREKGKEDIFTLCLQMVKYRFSFFNKKKKIYILLSEDKE